MIASIVIGVCAAVAVATLRHLEATDRATRRCSAMLRAATSMEVGRIDSGALFDELQRAYWLGREPRLTGLHATLYARTAAVRS